MGLEVANYFISQFCSVQILSWFLYFTDNGAGEPGNVNSNPPGGTSPGEMATEATEALVAPNTPKKMQNKGGALLRHA